jgi:tetratricopeptide (TPR) repeat protein
VDLDPISFNSKIALGVCLLYAREYDKAIEQLERGIAMSREAKMETSRPYPILATCWLMKGDKTKAFQYYRYAIKREPDNTQAQALFVFGAARSGETDEASIALSRLLQLRGAANNPFFIAIAFVAVGQHDRAFTYLERAFDSKDADISMLKSCIFMDTIRRDPRYLNLLARMNFT